MKTYVYSFGGGTADGDGKMKEVLGGKGAGSGGREYDGKQDPESHAYQTPSGPNRLGARCC